MKKKRERKKNRVKICDRRKKCFPLRHFISTRKKRNSFRCYSRLFCCTCRKRIAIKKKKKRIDRCRSSFRLSRQDWSRLQRSTGWQNVVIVKDSLVHALLFHYGNFFHWFAPRSKSAFAPQVFLQEKHRERENNKSKEKRIYRKGDERRNNAKRETGPGGKAWCPYIVRYAWVGGEMIKKDVRSDGCSFSPRIVRRCRCAFHFSCTS